MYQRLLKLLKLYYQVNSVIMRTFIFVVLGLILILGSMHLFRDILRPPGEANLLLTELSSEISRAELQRRLTGVEFNCSDGERLGHGEQACFAPVNRVDEIKADYLALFFDDKNMLAAVNIVTLPEEHANNITYLKKKLGSNAHKKIIDKNKWLVWQAEEEKKGIIMSHHESDNSTPPAIMWFRDIELAKRLLAQ